MTFMIDTVSQNRVKYYNIVWVKLSQHTWVSHMSSTYHTPLRWPPVIQLGRPPLRSEVRRFPTAFAQPALHFTSHWLILFTITVIVHAMLSKSDASFIDNLSTRIITNFRNDVSSLGRWRGQSHFSLCSNYNCDLFQTFPKEFIEGNPLIFLNFEWINIPKLKIFINGEHFWWTRIFIRIGN